MTGNIAIIPARGGSKRLPRKNILPMCGKPMLFWTVQAALESNLFDTVVVSTEDKEIEEIAKEAGAEISRRSPKLADDNATVVDVFEDYFKQSINAGKHYEKFCCLYPTAPFRNSEDIKSTMRLLEDSCCRFSIAVTAFEMYPYQAFKLDKGSSSIKPMWPELLELSAKKIGPLYGDSGSIYAAYVSDFLQQKTFFGTGLKAFLMPRIRVTDIDTIEDYAFAKLREHLLDKTSVN